MAKVRRTTGENQDEQDKQAQEREYKSALAKAKAALAKHLPKFTNASFDLGMASAIACAVGSIATPSWGLDPKALAALMGGLGVNWLATAIWEWRNKATDANKLDMQAEVERLAQAILPNMTDDRLREVSAQLGLVQATLTHLKDQDARDQVGRDALQRGLAERKTLVKFVSTEVINSVVNVAGGDININNSTFVMNDDGEAVRLKTEIDLYSRETVRVLRNLDLNAIDIQSADADSGQIALADIYTPLFTNALTGEAKYYKKSDLPDTPIRNAVKELGESAAQEWRERKQGGMFQAEPVFDEHGEALGMIAFKQTWQASSIISALNDTAHAVILGDPGSGKSTVLNYLALGLCGEVKDEAFKQEWHHPRLLPLRAELRNFARWLSADAKRKREPHLALLEYIEDSLRRATPKLAANLRYLLAQRGAAFLLDGLDEVPTRQRVDMKRVVEQLTELYPRCRFVVTCRTYSYRNPQQQLAPRGIRFAELPVQEFNDEQIQTFVQKWYAQIGLKRGKTDVQARAARLVSAISGGNNPRLRKLAANPLLLSLIASLHSFRGGDLPQDRQTLLKEAVDLLLLNWQRRKKSEEEEKGKETTQADAERRVFEALDRLGTHELLNVLYALAYAVHAHAPQNAIDDENSTADIPEAQLRAAFRNLLAGEGITDADIQIYLRDRAGLLINTSYATVGISSPSPPQTASANPRVGGWCASLGPLPNPPRPSDGTERGRGTASLPPHAGGCCSCWPCSCHTPRRDAPAANRHDVTAATKLGALENRRIRRPGRRFRKTALQHHSAAVML